MEKNWKKHIVNLDQLVPQESVVRRLETAMDYPWLMQQLKPYYPDIADSGAAPIRMICLVMLEHLRPTVVLFPPATQPIEAIYEEWRDNVSYMWILGAWPQDIPPFGDVFYDACDKLPPELLTGIFRHILGRCAADRIAGEYPEDVFYYLQKMPPAEREQELDRLAQAYTDQLFHEVNEVRKAVR